MILLNDKSGGPWGRGGRGGDNNRGDGGGPENPWSRKSSGNNRPSSGIDDAIDMMQRRFKKNFSGGGDGNSGGSFSNGGFSPRALALGGVVLAALWAFTGFFRVQEGELAVILRFGEMTRIVSPGLQYHMPAPFERVMIQKVSAVNQIDGGLRGNNGDATDQTLILTGDENMVHTNYTVLWKIKDIKEYLFTARKPEATIQVAAESVIREIIGQTQARAALTEGRDLIGHQAQELLQKLLDGYKIGIQIISVQLQSVAPPREVVESFTDVQSSLVDADQEVNKAESYRNDIIPRARGLAIQMIQDAEGFRASNIAKAEGDAARFNLVLSAYQQNPAVTKTRYYLETMEAVLMSTHNIILDAKVSQGVLPYLPIHDLNKTSPHDLLARNPAPQPKIEG